MYVCELFIRGCLKQEGGGTFDAKEPGGYVGVSLSEFDIFPKVLLAADDIEAIIDALCCLMQSRCLVECPCSFACDGIDTPSLSHMKR